MSLKRWSLALLLTFSTAALAEPPAGAPVSQEEVSEEALTCSGTRCSADWQCEGLCPGADLEVCVSGYCKYTWPTGGGGSDGGTGSVCSGLRCSTSSQCVCEGVQGSCTRGYCQFQ